MTVWAGAGRWGADVAELADVALVARAEQRVRKLATPSEKADRPSPSFSQKLDIHSTSHCSSNPRLRMACRRRTACGDRICHLSVYGSPRRRVKQTAQPSPGWLGGWVVGG